MIFLFYATLFIFTVVLHASVAEYFSAWIDAKPDVMLLTTVFLGLHRGGIAGLVGGFALGLVQDALSGGLLGLNALLKGLIGRSTGGLKIGMTSRLIFFHCVVVFFASTFSLAASAGLAKVFLPDAALPVEFWVDGTKTAGLTVVLAPAALGLLRKVESVALPFTKGAPYLERP